MFWGKKGLWGKKLSSDFKFYYLIVEIWEGSEKHKEGKCHPNLIMCY